MPPLDDSLASFRQRALDRARGDTMRASAKRSPSWPEEGWTRLSGITAERKREQDQETG